MIAGGTTALLQARGITKTFPGTIALKGVDFEIRPGQVHALIGENGAGKSTLVKILAGIDQPTSGTIELDGRGVRFEGVRDASSQGIGIIHQELELFPDLSVAENIFVGRERLTRFGLVDWAEQRRLAGESLSRLGQTIDPAVRVGALPLGQRQIVEIAKALAHNVRILMMDEPTSALTTAEVHVLFKVIRDLKAHGVAVVYISHRLEELLDIADTVTVLRDGAVVGEAAAADVTVSWIVERMTGRTHTQPRHDRAPVGGRPLLTVRDLRLPAEQGRTALHEISFTITSGEVVGIYGLMGAGRTELFESLLGVHEDVRGHAELDGDRLDGLSVDERVDAGLALVPEDRQASGLVQTLSVLENMTLSSLRRLARRGVLSPSAEAPAAARYADDLQIKTSSLDAPVTALSGGNQQKVVIGRGLMSQPKVLLLDEPTRGVDVGAKAEIVEAMRRLAGEGLGVVFASSELDEIFAASTRVLVMARGRITGEFDPAVTSADALASAASGKAPSTQRATDARA